MTRDMDLIRELLLRVEAMHIPAGAVMAVDLTEPEFQIEGFDLDQVSYNMSLLSGAGLLDTNNKPNLGAHIITKGLTWRGHDFLDSIRDPAIWRATKEGAKEAGGFTFELLTALAKGFLQKKIEEHTGVKLDI